MYLSRLPSFSNQKIHSEKGETLLLKESVTRNACYLIQLVVICILGKIFCLVEPAVCLHTPQSVMSPLVKMVYFW